MRLSGIVLFLGMFLFVSNIPVLSQPVLKGLDRTKNSGKNREKPAAKKDDVKNKAGNGAEDEPIRVETDLVASDILVLDRKGNAVLGLKKEDFIVTENGAAQDIEVFGVGESGQVPRSIVLILDYSGSLRPYIQNSVEAAKILVDKLRPQDRMAIVTDDVEVVTDFTKDKSLLKQKLDYLKETTLARTKAGASSQYSALLAVLNEMFDDEDIRPIIIFQTDGDEFPFLKPMVSISKEHDLAHRELCRKVPTRCERNFGLAEIKERIERSRATIYSIIPGVRFIGFSEKEKLTRAERSVSDLMRANFPNLTQGQVADFAKRQAPTEVLEKSVWQPPLAEVASLSGGDTEFLEKPEEAKNVYSKIFNAIEKRYVIGYYPKNQARDGKRRNVKIEVKGRPEYTVMGRKSYFAPLENK